MKPKKYLDVHIPLWWPSPRIDWRKWLPSRGSILFTVLAISLALMAQSAGALPGSAMQQASQSSTGTVAYQGRLADQSGNPVTGTYNMIFRLMTW